LSLSLLHIAVLVPFLFAVIIPVLGRMLRGIHIGWLVLPAPIALFVYFLTCIGNVQRGELIQESIPWIPSLNVDFTVYLDGLSLLFALLISGIGSLVVLYSIFYLEKDEEALGPFYVYLLLFMGAMLGVVLSDNVIVLYGFWELTSLTSFLLIAFWNKRERSLYGALKSMLITVLGGLAMLAGFVLLYVMTGTFSIRDLIAGAGDIADHALFLPSMLLILLGAFTKSAQFPFHIWLPDAMEAPTPVSAYLHSATMVKAGIYLVARFSPLYAGEELWFWLVAGCGLTTLAYASYRAIKQTDLKGMLAFSTISQLGLIMSLLGLGSAAAFYNGGAESLIYTKATMAAMLHLVNHAVFKGMLFMMVGIVDHETGTRDIRKLGGLMRLMPITFTVALIGTFSMAGLPPFGGFLSKEMFFTAMLNITKLELLNMQTLGVLFPIIAWLASICTFVYCMLLLFRTFTGRGNVSNLHRKPHEAPFGMLASPIMLAALAVVFGLFPNILSYTIIEPAMAAIHPSMLAEGAKFRVSIDFWHGWTMEIYMTIGVIAIGALLYKLQSRTVLLNRPLFTAPSLNGMYNAGLRMMDKGSNRMTRTYMTGSLRHYVIYIFVFLLVAVGMTLSKQSGIIFDFSAFAPMSLYEGIILAGMIAAVIAIPFSQSRMLSILLTGTAGYLVTLFFVIFRAPDLALTQMIVETVSVALFLLCFYHLPKLKKEDAKPRFKAVNLLVALGVGTVMTVVALAASSDRPFEPIANYFIEESYHLAGGKNIVNVILVDFRGFDTMLEIVVLCIASFAIYSLIKLKLPGEETDSSALIKRSLLAQGLWSEPRSNDVILKTVAKPAIFIILLFSIYLFFAGHNNPGGGFIGGLMTSAALVLMAMAFGLDTFARLIPINFRVFTAIGISIAFLTGMGSFLFDVPFLTHTFGHFDLPLLGSIELATATLFDLGVYINVVGITMTIITTIGRDR